MFSPTNMGFRNPRSPGTFTENMQHITIHYYQKAQKNQRDTMDGMRVTNILLNRVQNPETPEAIAAHQREVASKQLQTANTQVNIALIQHTISNAQDALSKELGERAERNAQERQKIAQLNDANTETLEAIRKNLDETEKQYKELQKQRENAASTNSAYFEGMFVGSVLTMAAYFLLKPKSAR